LTRRAPQAITSIPIQNFHTELKNSYKTRDIGKIAVETGIGGLDIIPSDFSYRNMDLFLDSEKKPKKRMAEFISRFEKDYDVIFLDSPPSFSLVSENIFNAADIMLIPLIPTTLSMRTYSQILEYLDEHRKLPLRIMPFFSMVDRRKKLHLEIIDQARENIPGVLKTVVPYLSIIESMGIRRAPVTVFAPRSDAAAIFASLWREIALGVKIGRR